MPATQRTKGARVERAIVAMHHDAGIAAEKVSRSGHAGPDLRIADQFTAEVKARKAGSGFVQLERWMGKADLLVLRRDRRSPLVCLRWELYVQLMTAYLRWGREDDADS